MIRGDRWGSFEEAEENTDQKAAGEVNREPVTLHQCHVYDTFLAFNSESKNYGFKLTMPPALVLC